MSNKSFEVGQIVKLKSGGPEMTINQVIINASTKKPSGSYRCQWFAGKKLDSGVFPLKSLVEVNTED